MRKRFYRKRKGDLEDALDGLVSLYALYLGSQYYLDRNNFWLWVFYGIGALVIAVGLMWLWPRIKGGTGRPLYVPYRKYFRRRPTREALRLGNLLKDMGWNVEFEKWDGHKHIDIAIPDAKFNIEVDGAQHNLNPQQVRADQKRDYYSEQQGYATKRIPNSVLRDGASAEEQARMIGQQLRSRMNNLQSHE
ncbi:MAG: DUF559 domain-containing protein [Patescibacteria group bacterium]|nr:DUF559 domain-containing protein [Patescibacteria group bacterium]